MEEGSCHGALPWAAHHGFSGPLKLVVESWATDSSFKTYYVNVFFFVKIPCVTNANTWEVRRLA
jgi:hypothetical protein